MEENTDIVKISTFLDYLTYYLKLMIYVNTGTTLDDVLDRCIKSYNKYEKIRFGGEDVSEEDNIFVIKCIKRINLILKIDSKSNPINIANKENQSKILSLKAHPSLSNGNIKQMLDYSAKNKITILSNVPLLFVIGKNKQQNLLWQYTRILFFITQILLSKTDPESYLSDPNFNQKNKIYNESLDMFCQVLQEIESCNGLDKLNESMGSDIFLNSNLEKFGSSIGDLDGARADVLKMLQESGMEITPQALKLIDNITGKLADGDNFDENNILQSIQSLAQTVAGEMQGDYEGDPDGFNNSMESLAVAFQHMVDDPNADDMPAEIKGLIGMAKNLSVESKDDPTGLEYDRRFKEKLDEIMNTNNLPRETFYDGNDINIERVQAYFMNNKI